MLKSFLNDAKFYFLVRGLLSVAFLLSIKIYTHFLDTSTYGVYAITFFIITIFSVCTTSWLSVSIIRMYPEWESKNVDFSPTLSTLLLFTMAVFTPILVIIFYFSKSTGFLEIGHSTVFFGVGYYIGLSIFSFLMARFTAMRDVTRFTVYSVLQFVCGVAIAATLLKTSKLGLNGILIGQTVSYIFFCYFIIFKRKLLSKKLNINKELLRQVFSYGIPLLFINIAANLLISSDQLVLKFFDFNAQVGAYAANYTLTDKSLTVLTGIFTTAYAPIMFGIFENESKQKAYSFFYKLIALYFIIIVPLCVVIYYFYHDFFSLVINKSYEMYEIIPLILLGSLFLNISNLFSDILTLNKNTKLLAFCYIAPLIISLSLNFHYIPTYGAKAAAVITAISYLCLMSSTVACALYYIKRSKQIEAA